MPRARCFADLAAAVADGADCIDGVGQLCGDREHVFGAKGSTTTMWRLVDQRIDAAHLPKVRSARAAARAAAWTAGAAPPAGQPLYIDIDAKANPPRREEPPNTGPRSGEPSSGAPAVKAESAPSNAATAGIEPASTTPRAPGSGPDMES